MKTKRKILLLLMRFDFYLSFISPIFISDLKLKVQNTQQILKLILILF